MAVVIYLTSGSLATFNVPTDFNILNNSVETVGAGGGGASGVVGTNTTGAGGGGGAYSKIANVNLTPGGTATYTVGVGGAIGTTGGDTWFNGTTLGGSSCGAKAGGGATGATFGPGGLASGSIGTAVNGGNGGAEANTVNGASAGGGAGGPGGAGKAGGSSGASTGFSQNGGGGGGNGGGSTGGTPLVDQFTGAPGGAAVDSTAGGSGGGAGVNGGTGSNGSGGGGGGSTNGAAVAGNGGAGGNGLDVGDGTKGSGGGGGGGGGRNSPDTSAAGNGGAGGLYGGGGGGGGWSSSTAGTGGVGGAGLIVITYVPAGGGTAVESADLNVAGYTGGAGYRDYFIPPVNLSLYSTPPAATPFFNPATAAQFSSQKYADPSNFGENAFLPSVIQTPVETFLNFIENVSKFDAKTYLDTLGYETFNAFLPSIIQGEIQSLTGGPFNGLNYRDSFFDGSAFLPRVLQFPILPLLGAPFNSLSYRDPANFDPSPNAFLPQTIQNPAQSLLGVPFNSLSYRDSSTWTRNPSLFPAPVGSPFFSPLPPLPFSGLNYRDPANFDPSPNAFLPSIIQGEIQSQLGAPFNGLNYRDSLFDANAFLPATIQNPVQSLLGVSFNGLNYRDYSLGGENPSLFPVATVSPFFNPIASVPFNNVSYRDPLGYQTFNAFLPRGFELGYTTTSIGSLYNLVGVTVANGPYIVPNSGTIESISVNCSTGRNSTLSLAVYSDVAGKPGSLLAQATGGPSHDAWNTINTTANPLFVAGQVVWLAYLSVVNSDTVRADPSSETVYNDAGGDLALPNPYLSPTFVANESRSLYATFLPSIGEPVGALIGPPPPPIPFNTLSYRDSSATSVNDNLYQAVVFSPFFGQALPAVFSTQSYRDRGFDSNAFLPFTIQGKVQAYLGAPFNALGYRDLANFGDNAFLPNIIQTPTSTFLNFVENAAPFNSATYRDTYVYPRNTELYPPPTTFPLVQSLLGAPFNALAFRDPTNVGDNAFLPSIIQTPASTFLNLIENVVLFNAKAYRDSYVYPLNQGLFPAPAVVQTPFFNPFPVVKFDVKGYFDTAAGLKNAFLPGVIQGKVQSQLGVPFSDGKYRDTSEYPPHPFLPRLIQPPVQRALGVPFADKSYRDTTKYPASSFLPTVIQGKVQSLLGAPFADSRYRDRFIVPQRVPFYPIPVTGVPFFNPFITVRFDPLSYIDNTECTRTETNIIVLCADKDAVIRIAVQDVFGNWLQPPFDIGRFEISLNGEPVLKCSTMRTNYSARPLPAFHAVPFYNPTQNVKFNPMMYVEQMIRGGHILP